VGREDFARVGQYNDSKPTFRSPRNFHCPKEFIPEKFMSSAHSKDFANDNRAAFQPFGLGRHSCIGQTLAYAEMRLILARLFFTFDVELADAADVWD
jgi:cytochrome P450